ncbi:MAG: hypothetical protein KGI91_04475 [Burkholderiales bacterium]|nr:hypothetical protein [Burkholderiales bacterium]MDE2076316.1 hypothetical protein [Burkholderiales bacterium]MDE2434331.1 hypothetical protein [Burkholderiales bacterium]
MNGETTMPAEPVTELIRRRVKAGRELEYEAWLQRLQAEARSLPGYLGVTTQADDLVGHAVDHPATVALDLPPIKDVLNAITGEKS